MRNPFLPLVIISFGIILVLAVFFISKNSVPVQQTASTSSSNLQASDWKIYSNAAAGITFDYPPNWQENTGQSFAVGDLFSLLMVGQTQRPQTELYDGARFAVMNPVSTSEETLSWMKKTYESDQPIDPERPPQYGEKTFAGRSYDSITVCGLGCFTYYHTKQNGKIYGFLLFAAGPNESSYQQIFTEIMESVQFS